MLPGNAEAVQLFQAAATQWRYVGGLEGARPVGLDYTGLRSTADWLGLAATPQLLGQIGVLEAETLKVRREHGTPERHTAD